MCPTKNRWFRRMGFGAIAALGLTVAALSGSPAQAHEFGYRAPVAGVHRVSHFPGFFYGFGHPWHHWHHHWR